MELAMAYFVLRASRIGVSHIRSRSDCRRVWRLLALSQTIFSAGAAAAPSRASSEHWMQGLTLKANTGAFDWEAVASVYDQKKDLTRTATPAIQVEDNTAGDVTWAIGASLAAGASTLSLHATHGWTGAGLRHRLLFLEFHLQVYRRSHTMYLR
jgi:hypothetical protein